MIRKSGIVWLVLAACLPWTVYGADIAQEHRENDVSVEMRYYAPKLKFQAKGFAVNIRALENFRDTFGFDNKDVPEYRIHSGRWSLDYIRVDEKTSHFPKNSQHLNDFLKSANLDLDYVALNYKKPFTASPRLDWYLLGGIRYYRFDYGIMFKDMTHHNVQKSQKLWVPAVGIGGKYYLDADRKWNVSGELSGGTLGKRGHFYDFDMGLGYRASPHLDWQVGYRVLDLKVKDSDREYAEWSDGHMISSVYKLSGWYGGVSYRF